MLGVVVIIVVVLCVEDGSWLWVRLRGVRVVGFWGCLSEVFRFFFVWCRFGEVLGRRV